MRTNLNRRNTAGSRSRGPRMAAIALLFALPSACGYYEYEPLDTPDTGGFLLQPVSITHEVRFLPGETKVAVEEKERLQAFIREVDPKEEAELWVDAAGDQAGGRRSAVLNALEHLGRTDVDKGASLSRSDVVTVTARRQVVLPKSCLDPTEWPDPRLLPASCTNMLNLMASVENQRDLIEGREAGMASGSVAAAALKGLLNTTPPRRDGAGSESTQVTQSSK